MNEFYVHITPKGITHGRPNTQADFLVACPWMKTLRGSWECALEEITMECEFTSQHERLYLCGDFLNETYVNENKYQTLRNVEVHGRSYVRETYTDKRFVPVLSGWPEFLRFYFLDEQFKPVSSKSDKLHCVLKFRRLYL